jgi:thiamine pyrophosphate-dependent acetolactate synthase large subunit-like protein
MTRSVQRSLLVMPAWMTFSEAVSILRACSNRGQPRLPRGARRRGVAHLTISKDVQMMKRSGDKKSMRNPGARSSSSWTAALSVPPTDQLQAAADALNAGTKVSILAGPGALASRDELTRLADLLGAPVAKSLLGKAVLPDNSPFTTGALAISGLRLRLGPPRIATPS